MNKFVYLLLAIIAGIAVYRYRYRVVNALLSIRILQKWFVRSSMSVPFVRNAMISQILR
ncbi:hypothetical protein HT574_12820 [Parageobacillus sp. VR-IP]|uniref:hypothetical protein n=1 Tax=Parageobacillus sp. VR-IP TaxID=2742205 RepID=UPI001583E7A8|nr:hypothetical protein [Parageobacillus sp. VR-IP]NUK30933.1 hypothetical protein [Parageobacillus sp. VR-IP]